MISLRNVEAAKPEFFFRENQLDFFFISRVLFVQVIIRKKESNEKREGSVSMPIAFVLVVLSRGRLGDLSFSLHNLYLRGLRAASTLPR